MSMNLSFHGVTSIRLEDVTHDGRTWARLFITDNRGQPVELTLFPADPDAPLRVEQPEDEPEDDEPVSYAAYRDSLGHTESQRQDIRDAGRGHLLP